MKSFPNVSNVNITSYQSGEVTGGYSGQSINSIKPISQNYNQQNTPHLNDQTSQFARPPSSQGTIGSYTPSQQRPSSGAPFENSFSSRPIRAASRGATLSSAVPQIKSISNEFYSRSFGGFSPQNAKISNSCIGPKCRLKPTRRRAINCDGNPQCILALTGKLVPTTKDKAGEISNLVES